jgi:hypothetical protein
LNHVQTVAKSKSGPLIAKLSEQKMDTIKSALLFALGYDD